MDSTIVIDLFTDGKRVETYSTSVKRLSGNLGVYKQYTNITPNAYIHQL
jgi:hypothetical protein